MDLSVALIIAASFAILCTFYIGKRKIACEKGNAPSEFKNPKRYEKRL